MATPATAAGRGQQRMRRGQRGWGGCRGSQGAHGKGPGLHDPSRLALLLPRSLRLVVALGSLLPASAAPAHGPHRSLRTAGCQRCGSCGWPGAQSGARPPGWMKRAAARALLGAGARQLLRADCVQLHDCCNLRRRCPLATLPYASPLARRQRRVRRGGAGGGGQLAHGTTSRRAAGTRTTAGAQTEEQAAAAHACPRAHPYACKINSSSRTPMTPARASVVSGHQPAARRRQCGGGSAPVVAACAAHSRHLLTFFTPLRISREGGPRKCCLPALERHGARAGGAAGPSTITRHAVPLPPCVTALLQRLCLSIRFTDTTCWPPGSPCRIAVSFLEGSCAPPTPSNHSDHVPAQ